MRQQSAEKVNSRIIAAANGQPIKLGEQHICITNYPLCFLLLVSSPPRMYFVACLFSNICLSVWTLSAQV